MRNYDERMMKSKCMDLLKQHDEVLKTIIEEENERINSLTNTGTNEFEVLKNTFTNEGIKEGMRRFLQKINEHASKNV